MIDNVKVWIYLCSWLWILSIYLYKGFINVDIRISINHLDRYLFIYVLAVEFSMRSEKRLRNDILVYWGIQVFYFYQNILSLLGNWQLESLAVCL